MFALEITFADGVSKPETLFVRRPHALIGAMDTAHVVIEDMKSLNYQLLIMRDLGRKFRCKPVPLEKGVEVPPMLEGVYEGSGTFNLGLIRLNIWALDSDLLLRETEPPDRAGVRVLRQACGSPGPLFPAVVVQGDPSVVMSFVPDQPIFIGRNKHCALRLDSPDISSKHARMGYESGEFWVEDLGSTNGTFVSDQQISGRVSVPAGVPILLGKEIAVVGVTSEDQIVRSPKATSTKLKRVGGMERKYPCVISLSEVARPAKMVIPVGATVAIGRDPTCDVWLGAPHVSRKHCVISLSKTGTISVVDHSTNGTSYDDGILARGDVLELDGKPITLDFGAGVTVALCFTSEHEEAFTKAEGSPDTFKPAQAQNADKARGDEPKETGHGEARIRVPTELNVRKALKQNSFQQLVSLYFSFGLTGKLAVIATGFLIVMVLVIIATLMVGT